jgi:hypothetical protein
MHLNESFRRDEYHVGRAMAGEVGKGQIDVGDSSWSECLFSRHVGKKASLPPPQLNDSI